jgi:lipoate-protein ligase A
MYVGIPPKRLNLLGFDIRFEDRGVESGDEHMKLDAALLLAGEPVVAIYGWSQPHVTLGRFQTPNDVLLADVSHSIRPTGGGAVLHGHDITLAIVLPLSKLGCGSREVKKIYRALAKPLVRAFCANGIEAVLAEEAGFLAVERSGYCFAANSPNDIVDKVSHRKLCGCAMIVQCGAVLLQVSIPVRQPDLQVANLIKGYVPLAVSHLNREKFWLDLANDCSV